MSANTTCVMNKKLLLQLVHEELVYQWVVCCSTRSMREFSYSNAWFFFELMVSALFTVQLNRELCQRVSWRIEPRTFVCPCVRERIELRTCVFLSVRQVKAMAEHLQRTGKLQAPRNTRFSRHFHDDVSKLLAMLTREVVENHGNNPLMRGLNMSVAFFLSDCLSLVDRSFVFNLISRYCKVVRTAYVPGVITLTLPLPNLRLFPRNTVATSGCALSTNSLL